MGDFKRVAILCDRHCSLVLALLRTGRLHQIRRHLDGANYQISGDRDYGKSGINELMREEYGLERIFLRAGVILMADRGQQVKIKAALPSDLRGALLKMQGGS